VPPAPEQVSAPLPVLACRSCCCLASAARRDSRSFWFLVANSNPTCLEMRQRPPFCAHSGRFHVTDDVTFLDLSKISGVGGYGYLLEPLWWVGMVTSKHQRSPSPPLFLIMPKLC
jgi:hypothetical protein